MPLLVCPSCTESAPMQAVVRHGVEIDVCSRCRGVWMDRGELEKLLEATKSARAEAEAEHLQFEQERARFRQDPAGYRPTPPPQGYGERGEAGEYGESGEYGHGRRRKRGFELFDFFD